MTTLSRPPARRRGRRFGGALLDALTFPHGPAAYRDAYRPGASAGRIAADVVAITPRTPRAHSLLLRPERPISFAPGQHVLVTVEIDGVRHTRCYSLSDTPHHADGFLEITVAHLPEGRVSTHLAGGDTPTGRSGIAVGDTVGISAPQGGAFVLPLPRPERVVLIGGGSGITPLRSMWRTMTAEGLGDRVRVVLYARTAADAIFADELAALPGATVVLTRERGGGPAAGRFAAEHLPALGIDPAGAQAFVCGPPGLVEAVTGTWTAAPGAGELRSESFAPPAAPATDDAAEGLLTFARSGASAHNDGRTILEQAEAAGLTPEAGCRMGICHTCTTTKHAGPVVDTRTGAIDDSEECEIQLCVTQPAGHVSLDL